MYQKLKAYPSSILKIKSNEINLLISPSSYQEQHTTSYIFYPPFQSRNNTGRWSQDENRKFIEALFDGLTVVHEEDLLIAIVSVLVEINSNYKDQDDNIFLQVHKTSSNSRVLDELLLRLLNNETSKERILKILLCLNKLMITEDSPIFYESDLESLIDIIINKLQSTYTENIKLFFMQMLAKITSYEAYYHNKYKDEEIDELMNDFLEREDQSAEVKKFSQEVVDNITNH